MSRVVSILKGIRTHWKKSTFAAAALSYGVLYARSKFEIHQLMREYCTEATAYGTTPLPASARPKTVLVILNPTANKRSSQKTFDEYCAPILHLAGIAIDIVQTDSEGHARRYVEDLEKLPDAILVAGGDGTVSETVTGLLRRHTHEDCPIGLIPVGRTNTIAKQLFNYTNDSNLNEVQGLAKAAIAIVRGKTEPKDVMKIEQISDTDQPIRPIYALASVHWGAFRDAFTLRDKYWYFGPLREYSAFLFNAFSDRLTWNCSAKLTYSPPCNGCSNCYVKLQEMPKNPNRRWWSGFLSRSGKPAPGSGPDYSKVTNNNCRTVNEMDVKPSEMLFSTNITRQAQETPKLNIQFGKDDESGVDFVLNSWSRIRNEEFTPHMELDVRSVEILPEKVFSEENELFFSIDNEAYEVKPVRISVVPKAVQMYTL